MIDIVVFRQGNRFVPFSDEDRLAAMSMSQSTALRARISGARKERAYRELCAYFGSCRYISELNLNDNMNTKGKVDHLTRLKCGFVEGTVFDERGLLHWIPKSLSYTNCDQPDAHEFIAKALEEHAALAGIHDVDTYLRLLREQ